jgi:hypothetical protein
VCSARAGIGVVKAEGTRSRAASDKRLARSKQWKRLASAADWLGGAAKPPAVGWSSYDGRTRKCRGTARAGGCRGR